MLHHEYMKLNMRISKHSGAMQGPWAAMHSPATALHSAHSRSDRFRACAAQAMRIAKIVNMTTAIMVIQMNASDVMESPWHACDQGNSVMMPAVKDLS